MKKLLLLMPISYLLLLLFQVEKAFTQDLGRHLILGKIIIECLCIPTTNLFSYTAPNFEFINHHWLPEVIFYGITQVLGFTALLWFKISVIVVSFCLLLSIVYKKVNSFLIVACSIPFIFVFSERFDVRPEIFSFFFLSLFLVLIYQYRLTSKLRFLLPLVVIQIVWVNSHIYFFIGALLYGFLLADLFLRKKLTRHVVIIGLCLAGALLINPHGLTGALYPLNVFGNYGYSIVENQNIFFLNSFFFSPKILIFELLILPVVVAGIYHLKKRNTFEVLCLLFAVTAGIMMIRNFPLFVFIAFPPLVFTLSDILQNLKPHVRKNVQISLLVCLVFVIAIHSIQLIRSQNFGLRYVYGAEKAVNFLEQEKLPGNIFNNFDIGSYLIYRLYPSYKVFVDGRPEAYPADFFDNYKAMQMDPELFEQQVMRYDINTVFFAHTDITPWAQQFLQSIVSDSRWVPVYIDDRIIIFIRNDSKYNHIIQQYKVQLPNS